MPRRPATWLRRTKAKPVAEYVCWSDNDRSTRSKLLCTWLHNWHEPEAARIQMISLKRTKSHPLLEKICHRCPDCRIVWHEKFTKPVDVTLLNQTYGGDKLTPAKFRNVRLTLPYGSVPAIARIETLEKLSSYTDDKWLFGNVYLESGDLLGGFRSVVDSQYIPVRKKYHKEWFKYHGSAYFQECKRCGAFENHLSMGGTYILASELVGQAIRLDLGQLLLERSLAEKLKLFDNRLWPGGCWYRIPVYDERLDPIPTPYPRTWSDLIKGVRANADFPFEDFAPWTDKLKADVE